MSALPITTALPAGTCSGNILATAETYSGCVNGWQPPVPLLTEADGWITVLLFGGIFAIFTIFLLKFFPKMLGVEETSEWFNTAGRNIGAGMTSAVLVSQWTWAATLLQSSNVAWKYGVSGPYWYASGATIQIILFGMLAIELKRKAPNAHTFLEIIKVRWGFTAHKVFMVFALMANIIVTAMLLLGGSAVVNSLTGMNLYASLFFIPVGVMTYTLVGGLKATFVASYVHSFLIYLFLLIFIFAIYATDSELGSISKVYEGVQRAAAMNAQVGAKDGVPPFLDGNMEGSYLTMASTGGFIFGIINVVGNFGTVFVDQSYWQSAIAARPQATVRGFIIGGLSWFAIPFGMATSLGLANLAFNVQMSIADAGSGLVPPFTAVKLFDKAGAWMILIQLFMAVTSTGSAELIAVSSIITYDIYQTYIEPEATGQRLLQISKLGVVLFGIIMGCLGAILHAIGLNLGWVYLAMGVIIGSAVIPVSCVLMSKTVTAGGAISGCVGGFFLGVVSWIVTAAIEQGEVTIASLGGDYPMLTGNLFAILGSGLIVFVYTHFIDSENYDFEGTRNIKIVDGNEVQYANKEETDPQALTDAYWFAVKWGSLFSVIIVVIVPLILFFVGVFSEGFFGFWVVLCFIWSICAAIAVIFLPMYDFFTDDAAKPSEAEMAEQGTVKRSPEPMGTAEGTHI